MKNSTYKVSIHSLIKSIVPNCENVSLLQQVCQE